MTDQPTDETQLTDEQQARLLPYAAIFQRLNVVPLETLDKVLKRAQSDRYHGMLDVTFELLGNSRDYELRIRMRRRPADHQPLRRAIEAELDPALVKDLFERITTVGEELKRQSEAPRPRLVTREIDCATGEVSEKVEYPEPEPAAS